jgi:DNA-binding transcriptional LysR family regulator
MDRLAAMETFVRVVETGSFSAAARLLRLGQPAISKTIAQLEDRLGVKLRAEDGHPQRLIADGAPHRAQPAFRDWDALVLQARRNAEEARRPGRPSDRRLHARKRAWTFRQRGSETSVALTGRLRVTAAEGVRAAVLANLGVTVASAWMFAPELESGAVKAVLTDWELPSIDLWTIFPTGRIAPAKARAFVSFIEKSLPNLG